MKIHCQLILRLPFAGRHIFHNQKRNLPNLSRCKTHDGFTGRVAPKMPRTESAIKSQSAIALFRWGCYNHGVGTICLGCFCEMHAINIVQWTYIVHCIHYFIHTMNCCASPIESMRVPWCSQWLMTNLISWHFAVAWFCPRIERKYSVVGLVARVYNKEVDTPEPAGATIVY